MLPADISIRRFNQPGPILNIIGPGFATKLPRFNGLYVGPVGFPATTDPNAVNAPSASLVNGYLNASGAKAYVEGGNLVLTGIIAGVVQPSPAAGQESFYNFGINRGAATAPGPFFGKPKVAFDSVVQVGFTAAGPYATVTTLDVHTGAVTGTTSLPVSNIATKTDAVQVLVPLSALPSTGFPVAKYRVSFFPSDKAVPANFNDIASVLPENKHVPGQGCSDVTRPSPTAGEPSRWPRSMPPPRATMAPPATRTATAVACRRFNSTRAHGNPTLGSGSLELVGPIFGGDPRLAASPRLVVESVA